MAFLAHRRKAFATGGGDNGLLTDLVAYWKLDEASGTRVDSHGSYDLTDTGSTGSRTGVISDAADFANATGLDAGGTDLDDLGSNYSISLWLKADDTTNLDVVIGACRNTKGYKVNFDGTNLAFEIYDTAWNTVTSDSAFSTTGFHHVVAILNSGTMSMYINNSAQAGTASPGAMLVADNFHIGAQQGTQRFLDGAVDETAIWSRALSADDVTALYNSGSGLAYGSFTS